MEVTVTCLRIQSQIYNWSVLRRAFIRYYKISWVTTQNNKQLSADKLQVHYDLGSGTKSDKIGVLRRHSVTCKES